MRNKTFYLKHQRRKAKADGSLDPRIAKLLPEIKGDAWRVGLVELDTWGKPLELEQSRTMVLHFIVKETALREWLAWCGRILRAGDALGVAISQELMLLEGKLRSDWLISFNYQLTNEEDKQTRELEALQQFVDILRASR